MKVGEGFFATNNYGVYFYLIGSLLFLNKWIVRSEVTNALDKIFVKNV